MDTSIIRRLGVHIQPNDKLQVVVANGEKLASEGKCENLEINVQGAIIKSDFYLLTLGGCDIVFGAHWLRTLGPILWDFNQLWMKFKHNNEQFQLVGFQSTDWEVVDTSTFTKDVRKCGKGLLLQLLSNFRFGHIIKQKSCIGCSASAIPRCL